MVKMLTKHGNSYALIIDKPILELLGINPEQPVELTTNGNSLTVTPATAMNRETRFAQALERVNARHGAALKRLAE